MSAMRTSLTEPFALTQRVRESFADWFEQDAVRVSCPSVAYADISEPHDMIVVRGAGELAPTAAGAMAGAMAGPAMLGTATLLSARAHHAIDLPGLIGTALHAPVQWAHPAGWALAVVVGAVIGSVFAVFTRRLRHFAPMIAFGMIASFALWTLVHAFALPRIAPWLAKMLPYGPMVLASIAFGSLLALQVPIRTRKIV
jgi:hypothetical protein